MLRATTLISLLLCFPFTVDSSPDLCTTTTRTLSYDAYVKMEAGENTCLIHRVPQMAVLEDTAIGCSLLTHNATYLSIHIVHTVLRFRIILFVNVFKGCFDCWDGKGRGWRKSTRSQWNHKIHLAVFVHQDSDYYWCCNYFHFSGGGAVVKLQRMHSNSSHRIRSSACVAVANSFTSIKNLNNHANYNMQNLNWRTTSRMQRQVIRKKCLLM